MIKYFLIFFVFIVTIQSKINLLEIDHKICSTNSLKPDNILKNIFCDDKYTKNSSISIEIIEINKNNIIFSINKDLKTKKYFMEYNVYNNKQNTSLYDNDGFHIIIYFLFSFIIMILLVKLFNL